LPQYLLYREQFSQLAEQRQERGGFVKFVAIFDNKYAMKRRGLA
jgi:hypothetical protein